MKITLNLPDAANMNENEVTILVAVSLYEKGKLTFGQATYVAGLSKRTFIEILGNYGVSIFNYPATEIANDVKNA